MKNVTSGMPKGWATALLPNLLGLNGEMTDGDWVESKDQDPNGEVRLIQLADIGDGVFRDRSDRFLNSVKAHELRCTFLHAGDVLVARMPEPLGRACQVPPLEDLWCTVVDVCILRPGTRSVNPRWLMHFVNTPQFRVQIADLQSGSTRKRISKANLGTIPLPVPPVREQASIAEKIDAYHSQLDAAIDGLKRVQANLKRYRASVLKAAVEGRLVPTEAELAKAEGRAFEPASELLARILKERRARWEAAELASMQAKGKPPKSDAWKSRYEEPIAPDTKGLPKLPEGWCWATTAQLTFAMTSGSRDWSKYYGEGDSTFIMAQNVRPGRLDLSFRQPINPPPNDPSRARSQVEVNDLLVTIVGANTGDVCRVQDPLPLHYVCQSVALMRPVVGELATHLELAMCSPIGQGAYAKFMYGQGRPHLSFENLAETPIPLPPISEQRRILTSAGEALSVATHSEAANTATLARCARLRQSILKWAFEGKLVDQDPNDEPASVLLERLRAERGVASSLGTRRAKQSTKSENQPDSAPNAKRSRAKKANVA